MKKKIIGLLVAATMITSSVCVVSAATSSDSCHTYADVTYGSTWNESYTHPVCVAYQPDGTPIIVECSATDKWQNYKHMCVYCQYVEYTGKKIVAKNRTISH